MNPVDRRRIRSVSRLDAVCARAGQAPLERPSPKPRSRSRSLQVANFRARRYDDAVPFLKQICAGNGTSLARLIDIPGAAGHRRHVQLAPVDDDDGIRPATRCCLISAPGARRTPPGSIVRSFGPSGASGPRARICRGTPSVELFGGSAPFRFVDLSHSSVITVSVAPRVGGFRSYSAFPRPRRACHPPPAPLPIRPP